MFSFSVTADSEIQKLALNYLEQISIKYGDIYTEFPDQEEFFVNNIDHIAISESHSTNCVVRTLFVDGQRLENCK